MPSPSLTTCCAHCRTVFRVTTAQLQAHAGQVRCGRCMQVFNALAALAPEPAQVDIERIPASALQPAAAPATAEIAVVEVPEAVAPLSPEPEHAQEPSAATVEAEPVTQQSEPFSQEPLPETVADDAGVIAKVSGVDDDGAVDKPDAIEAIEAAPQGIATVAESEPGTDSDNPFVQAPVDETPAEPRRRLFVVASAVMVTLLAAQAVFFYRSEIAARYPPAKQWLASLCAQAGCTVNLPQRPQSILIEASDLQVADPASPNRIQLTATLRNHAGYDVAYPALDLVLTNVNDHTLARRIFLPEDYLGKGRNVGNGIAANAELTVRLALETGNLGAAGFRLAVLSAPVR